MTDTEIGRPHRPGEDWDRGLTRAGMHGRLEALAELAGEFLTDRSAEIWGREIVHAELAGRLVAIADRLALLSEEARCALLIGLAAATGADEVDPGTQMPQHRPGPDLGPDAAECWASAVDALLHGCLAQRPPLPVAEDAVMAADAADWAARATLAERRAYFAAIWQRLNREQRRGFLDKVAAARIVV